MAKIPYTLTSMLVPNTWAELNNMSKLDSVSYCLIKDSTINLNVDSGLLPEVKAITADGINFTVMHTGEVNFPVTNTTGTYVNNHSSYNLFQYLVNYLQSGSTEFDVIYFTAVDDTGETYSDNILTKDMHVSVSGEAKVITAPVPGTMSTRMIAYQPKGIYFLTGTEKTFQVVSMVLYRGNKEG